jgi:hypothetical protein
LKPGDRQWPLFINISVYDDEGTYPARIALLNAEPIGNTEDNLKLQKSESEF